MQEKVLLKKNSYFGSKVARPLFMFPPFFRGTRRMEARLRLQWWFDILVFDSQEVKKFQIHISYPCNIWLKPLQQTILQGEYLDGGNRHPECTLVLSVIEGWPPTKVVLDLIHQWRAKCPLSSRVVFNSWSSSINGDLPFCALYSCSPLGVRHVCANISHIPIGCPKEIQLNKFRKFHNMTIICYRFKIVCGPIKRFVKRNPLTYPHTHTNAGHIVKVSLQNKLYRKWVATHCV